MEIFLRVQFSCYKRNFLQLFPTTIDLKFTSNVAEIIEIFTEKSAETCSRNENLNFKGKEKLRKLFSVFSSSEKMLKTVEEMGQFDKNFKVELSSLAMFFLYPETAI